MWAPQLSRLELMGFRPGCCPVAERVVLHEDSTLREKALLTWHVSRSVDLFLEALALGRRCLIPAK